MRTSKVRMGMIGGGIGAFIGSVHRMAAVLDGKIELVCGAFSGDAQKSLESGLELGLPKNRIYGSYQEMIEKERNLPDDEKMELISVVTPNHLHFEPVKMGLEAGFNVICDKPLCFNLEEAYQLRDVVKTSGKIFALTHNYTGYPMVKQARFLVQSGSLGTIKKVVTEYSQGWLSRAIEKEGQKQASWRTDPTKAGIAGALGDIGTHAENLSRYITGMEYDFICADVRTLVKGRALDDDGNILIKYKNGASGILFASQISAGEENNLRIKVYGESGSLEWSQMEPNTLITKWLDQPIKVFRTGGPDLCQHATLHTRIPAGHPEGYIEAFANIYRNVALAIGRQDQTKKEDNLLYDFPGIEDGIGGMEFIQKVIESGHSNTKWIEY